MRTRSARLTLLCAVMACSGGGIVSPDGPIIARTGSTSGSLAIVGTWERRVFLLDDPRFGTSPETTYVELARQVSLRVAT